MMINNAYHYIKGKNSFLPQLFLKQDEHKAFFLESLPHKLFYKAYSQKSKIEDQLNCEKILLSKAIVNIFSEVSSFDIFEDMKFKFENKITNDFYLNKNAFEHLLYQVIVNFFYIVKNFNNNIYIVLKQTKNDKIILSLSSDKEIILISELLPEESEDLVNQEDLENSLPYSFKQVKEEIKAHGGKILLHHNRYKGAVINLIFSL